MPLYVTVPVTPPLSVKVDVPIVVVSIDSLKVAAIASLTSTPVAPFNGLVEMTVGAVVSGRVVVVVLLVVVVVLVVVLVVVVGTVVVVVVVGIVVVVVDVVVLLVVVVVLDVVVLLVVVVGTVVVVLIVVVVVVVVVGVRVTNEVSLPYDAPALFSAAIL